VILSDGETFSVDETWLTPVTPKTAASSVPLVANLVDHEKEMIETALREAEGLVSGPTGAAPSLASLGRRSNQRSGNSVLTDIVLRPHKRITQRRLRSQYRER